MLLLIEKKLFGATEYELGIVEDFFLVMINTLSFFVAYQYSVQTQIHARPPHTDTQGSSVLGFLVFRHYSMDIKNSLFT